MTTAPAALQPGAPAATRTLTLGQALNEAFHEEMRRDRLVFIMGEDVATWGQGGAFGIKRGLVDEFGPARVRNTPISEPGMAGLAVGAALVGARPIVEVMIMDHITLMMDQICNQAAKLRYMFGGQAKVPLVIRGQGGGGAASAAQHSQSLEAWFVHVPGLKVIAPSTPYDAKGLLKSAIRDDNPVICFEHKLLYRESGPVPEDEYLVPLGVADVKRAGADVTIVGVHTLVNRALAAAERLQREDGIGVEVIDPRTLSPLDVETIAQSVRKTHRLIVAHEGYEQGGVGAEIVARVQEVAFDYLDAPIKRVCGANVPIPYAPDLERAVLPQEDDLVAAIRAMLG